MPRSRAFKMAGTRYRLTLGRALPPSKFSSFSFLSITDIIAVECTEARTRAE